MRLNLHSVDMYKFTEQYPFITSLLKKFSQEYEFESYHIYPYLHSAEGLAEFVRYMNNNGITSAKAYMLPIGKTNLSDKFQPMKCCLAYGIEFDDDEPAIVEWKLVNA